MSNVPPRAPLVPPHDLLHAVAVATGTPMAYLQWPGGRCIWATATYARLLEMPSQELLDKAPQSYLSPCTWNEWKCELERLADSPQPGTSLQTPLSFARQQAVPTQLVADVQHGAVRAIVVIPLQDLSHTDALQMVQDSDTRLQRYAHATREAIIFFRQGRVFDANPAAIALTGYWTADDRVWARKLFAFSIVAITALSVMMSIDFQVAPATHLVASLL